MIMKQQRDCTKLINISGIIILFVTFTIFCLMTISSTQIIIYPCIIEKMINYTCNNNIMIVTYNASIIQCNNEPNITRIVNFECIYDKHHCNIIYCLNQIDINGSNPYWSYYIHIEPYYWILVKHKNDVQYHESFIFLLLSTITTFFLLFVVITIHIVYYYYHTQID